MSLKKLLPRMIGLTLVMLLLAACGTSQPASTPDPPTPTPIPPTNTPLLPTATPAIESSDKGKLESQPVTLFAIGRENNSDGEFAARGFRGHPEYTCRVGVDCLTEAFPASLCRTPESHAASYDDEVKRITITLTLDQDYGELALRLVRAGAETTVVTVDGQQTYLVTNTMLGSNEGWVVGAYDLMLGALKKGTHTIQMTVADDGKGNGHYGWDALALLAR